jgi:hypothetical protein
MASYGTGPEALVRLLETNWQESRTGRDDVPPIIQHTTGSDDPKLENGVYPLRNREESGVNLGRHDVIHCYHPEAGPFAIQDTGYAEQNVVETIQIDIELTDRTDQTTDTRLSARDRMVSERGSLADLAEPPYPGILGEVKYVLETVRRGFDEYDTVSHNIINHYLGNSNANASFSVELERIAAPTVQ